MALRLRIAPDVRVSLAPICSGESPCLASLFKVSSSVTFHGRWDMILSLRLQHFCDILAGLNFEIACRIWSVACRQGGSIIVEPLWLLVLTAPMLARS
jgi:hypothetical protein